MNKKSNNLYFIIDFDSTFVTVESLEALAAITLENVQIEKRFSEK